MEKICKDLTDVLLVEYEKNPEKWSLAQKMALAERLISEDKIKTPEEYFKIINGEPL